MRSGKIAGRGAHRSPVPPTTTPWRSSKQVRFSRLAQAQARILFARSAKKRSK